MKKRLLFVVTNLGTGGILRSLQNFLNCYDVSLFDVDVFALTHQGVYRDELKRCTVLPVRHILDALMARYEYQKGWAKVLSLFTKTLNKITADGFLRKLFNRISNQLVAKTQYDAVIGFSEGVPTLFVSMMEHPNKIGWIHCDYSSYIKINGGKSELAIYEKFQHVVCVSDFTRRSFCNVYPSLESKTLSIYNIIDDSMMKDKAEDVVEESFNDECFNILSVGRIDPIKRLSIIPELANEIQSSGCKICWYVVGPKGTTSEVEKLEHNMKKFKSEDVVFLLGEKKNPYPYIANVDLLVNTSISEACPYVINEAKILGTPVVCTDFGSASEFIVNGENGYIVPIERMADCIAMLIKHPDVLHKLNTNLNSFEYKNNQLLEQIYALV